MVIDPQMMTLCLVVFIVGEFLLLSLLVTLLTKVTRWTLFFQENTNDWLDQIRQARKQCTQLSNQVGAIKLEANMIPVMSTTPQGKVILWVLKRLIAKSTTTSTN
jgi:hypothetical protein